MAFKSNNSTGSKNMFVATFISRKTGKAGGWVNLTHTYAKDIWGKELNKVTAEEALEVVPGHYSNAYFDVVIKDLTEAQQTIDPSQF